MKSNNFQYIKTGIFIFLYCFLTEIGFSQMFFKKEYLCSFSGTKNLPGKICETSDGGFALLVNTNDIYGGFIMKTDHSGHIDYIKQYNLLPFVGNELHDMMFLPDTSLIFIGAFKSNGSTYSPILVKTDMNGEIIWSKVFNASDSKNCLVKRTDATSYLAFNGLGSNGIELLSIDINGNSLNAIKITPANSYLTLRNAKSLNNNEIMLIGKQSLTQNPLIMVLDTLNNLIYSMEYPGYSEIHDVVQSSDLGFISLMQYGGGSFSVVKTDSSGIPIWSKTFSDSTKYLLSKTILENEDKTMYCVTNWVGNGSNTYWSAIIHLDSTGNIISIKDSLLIHNYISLTKTADNKFLSLYADGWANSYHPTLLMTDSSFSANTFSCYSDKPSTITQTNSTSVAIASPHQITTTTSSSIPIILQDSLSSSTVISTCLPGGVTCATTFDTLNVSSCYNYISPSGNYTWNQSGNYTDTIYNTLGCDSIISINLSILQASVNVVTALGPLTFCKGDSVVLSATPGMINYQWYRWNNTIAGATSANFTAKSRGKYKCIASDSLTCSDTSNVIVVHIPCTQTGPNHEKSQSLIAAESKGHIFPNPGTGIFNFEFPPGELQVFNAVGKMILFIDNTEDINYVDLSGFSDGIYFVKYITSKSSEYNKIILSR